MFLSRLIVFCASLPAMFIAGGSPASAQESDPVRLNDSFQVNRLYLAAARGELGFELPTAAPFNPPTSMSWQDPLAVVANRPLRFDDLRRHMILLWGGPEIDRLITLEITRQAVENAKRQGASSDAFSVEERELEESIDAKMEMAPKLSGLSAEEWKTQVEVEFGWEAFRESERTQLAFGKAFFPESPYPGAPDIEEYLNPQLSAMIHQYRERGKTIPHIFRQSMLTQIRDRVVASTPITYYFEQRLPEDVFLEVDGTAIHVETLWELVEPRIDESRQSHALRDLIVTCAVDDALQRLGAALDHAQGRSAYDQFAEKYEGTLFPPAMVISMRGYASRHHFLDSLRRREAHTRWLKKSMLPDAYRRALEDYLSASPSQGWENLKVRARLDDGRGGLETRELTRHELRRELQESAASVFAQGGFSLADLLFFRGLPGAVHPYGDGARLEIRGFLKSPTRRDEKTVREASEEEFLELRFQEFVHRTLRDVSLTFPM